MRDIILDLQYSQVQNPNASEKVFIIDDWRWLVWLWNPPNYFWSNIVWVCFNGVFWALIACQIEFFFQMFSNIFQSWEEIYSLHIRKENPVLLSKQQMAFQSFETSMCFPIPSWFLLQISWCRSSFRQGSGSFDYFFWAFSIGLAQITFLILELMSFLER